jgi:hypothetical protein
MSREPPQNLPERRHFGPREQLHRDGGGYENLAPPIHRGGEVAQGGVGITGPVPAETSPAAGRGRAARWEPRLVCDAALTRNCMGPIVGTFSADHGRTGSIRDDV